MKDFARIHAAWMEADGAITEGRNRIAHGDTSISGIIIPTVVQDLRRLARTLRS